MKKPIRTMLSVQATPDIAGIRTATLMNQEHTVIPCICLVEGVLWPANAPGPELALAEEFGRFPQGWNGRPVTYDHPKIDGAPVSASSPDVLQDNAFGQLFNTELKGGKLHTEIWINETRIAELGEEAQATIQNLKDGTGVAEVSTGLFTMSEPRDGEWEGAAYTSVWRNIVPDHLAVLPEGITGACSVADGCGAPRLNSTEAAPATDWQPVMRAAQMCAECETIEDADEQVGMFRKLLDLGGGIFNFKKTMKDNSAGISDSDLRAAIYAGVQATTEGYIYVLAVYSASPASGTFVYESGWDGTLFENTFMIDGGGSISIGSEPVQVRPQTTFIPVQITANSTTQENAMNEKLVNDLIANAGTQYTENDREWLSTLEDDQLNKMVPVEAEAVVEVEATPAVNAEAAAASAPAAAAKPITTNEYIADAPEEVREILESGVRMHRQRKDALVSALTSNARCRFSADQLNAKTVDELENLAELAQDISYEGKGVTLVDNTAEEQEQGFTPAPTIFKLNTAAEA